MWSFSTKPENVSGHAGYCPQHCHLLVRPLHQSPCHSCCCKLKPKAFEGTSLECVNAASKCFSTQRILRCKGLHIHRIAISWTVNQCTMRTYECVSPAQEHAVTQILVPIAPMATTIITFIATTTIPIICMTTMMKWFWTTYHLNCLNYSKQCSIYILFSGMYIYLLYIARTCVICIFFPGIIPWVIYIWTYMNNFDFIMILDLGEVMFIHARCLGITNTRVTVHRQDSICPYGAYAGLSVHCNIYTYIAILEHICTRGKQLL